MPKYGVWEDANDDRVRKIFKSWGWPFVRKERYGRVAYHDDVDGHEGSINLINCSETIANAICRQVNAIYPGRTMVMAQMLNDENGAIRFKKIGP